MATRFYLPSSGAAAVAVAIDASWTKNLSTTNKFRCVTTKSGSSFVSTVITEDSNTTNNNMWIAYQYVSDPIAAQTITGTLSSWFYSRENSSGANYFGQLVARVVSGDGLTVRGTLVPSQSYTGSAGADEIRATTTTTSWGIRAFPVAGDSSVSPSPGSGYISGFPVNSVTAQDGDVIVIEFGHIANNTVSTAFTGTYRIGDSAASDIPESEGNPGTTNDANPFCEFSQTLNFFSGGGSPLFLDSANLSGLGAAGPFFGNPIG